LKKEFYSHGKLLLTGEYLVLDGATALAIPTVYGQTLTVATTSSGLIEWESEDELANNWFTAVFSSELTVAKTNQPEVAQRLQEILLTARQINPEFLSDLTGYLIKTKLDFPREWGLGTSSTLINNIAQWAGVDSFRLLEQSFGGSGYDIAAAQSDTALLYTRTSGEPHIENIELKWDFIHRLFFVHLNKKQDSKEGISRYRALAQSQTLIKDRITQITSEIITSDSLTHFTHLMEEHESLVAALLKLPTIKESQFPDYKGLVKSLGAWGGDFVLASGDEAGQGYFRKKGYNTIIPFAEMIL
jgi:mevalonate kinase